MKTAALTALVLCLLGCGDAPPKQEQEKAAVQQNLRVEYYEISKK